MKREKGFGLVGVLSVVLVAAVTVTAITIVSPLMAASTIPGAQSLLTQNGYVVLAAGEYSALTARLEAIRVAALTAVTNADNARIAAEAAVDAVDFYNTAEVFVYPTTTDRTCTLTAGLADAFGAWAEVTDSGATTLTSKFAAKGGYLSAVLAFNHSVPAEMYILEIAYGAGHTVVGRIRIFADWTYLVNIKSRNIPAGETVYYRMAAETGGLLAGWGLTIS